MVETLRRGGKILSLSKRNYFADLKTQTFYLALNAGTGGANGTTQSSDGAKPTEKSPLKNDSKNKYAAGK